MMQLRAIVDILNDIAPPGGAEAWDNTGLLWGDPQASVARVLMAIDATPAVLAEAAKRQVHLLVAYHPPLFKAVKRVPPNHPLFAAAQGGFALFSPHTALDAAKGGTNDVLADAAGLKARTPLVYGATPASHVKLVVFVPDAHVAEVREALFAAGAGRIGAYSRCSYQTPGTGSFRPDAEAKPVIGRPLEDTHAKEQRLECVVPKSARGRVVAALFASHPYETPAFDLVALADGQSDQGQGRIGALPEAMACDAQSLADRLKRAMGAKHIMVAMPQGQPKDALVRRIAVQAGAGDSMLDEVCAQKADVFVTGELRHHTILAALARGVGVITLTHDDSERAALVPYAEKLRARAAGVEVALSQEDRSPFWP